MRFCKLFIQVLLLITTPTLLAAPSGGYSPGKNFKKKERYHLITYDEIVELLDDIESGKAEKKYSSKEFKRINRFLAYLATEGALPASEYTLALQADIHDLLDDNLYGHNYQIFLASNWFSINWKKTKKFTKKHKKEILIGAAIVVAASVVVIAVAASASACAATAVATAGAAAASNMPPTHDPYITLEEAKEAPLLNERLEENVATFKEFMAEDLLATPPPSWDDLSFGEKTRELGAFLAHQAFEEISDLASIAPQFAEEVHNVANHLLPDQSEDPLQKSPMDNFDTLIANGHQAIDKVFSTDQAEIYSPEFRRDNLQEPFAIGMIPLPGGLQNVLSRARNIIESGRIFDRAGFTMVGRSLMKHGYREKSIFPKPYGNPRQVNQEGQKILEEIINDPRSEVFTTERGSIKIYSPNGRGVKLSKDWNFKHFIERQYE